MKDVKITEVRSGKGKIAVFNYNGTDDPVLLLDKAIGLYTQGQKYKEFIDINMNNPWIRVILSGIDDVMQGSVNFYDTNIQRNIKLSHILKDSNE
jgi:hypothetical protein